MQSRRSFLMTAMSALAAPMWFSAAQAASLPEGFHGGDVFDRIVVKAKANGWNYLPIGQLMGKIAIELEGTPYVGNTLETGDNPEACSVDLSRLDCVTFFESTLGLARMIKSGGKTPEDLMRQISFTRYRGGSVGDYTTRLHYTKDWLLDNQAKHVVQILADLPGERPFQQQVGFMTANANLYPQLKAHPELVSKLKMIEQEINSKEIKFVPVHALRLVEPHLQTGDIVGITTNRPGLDISHTGLAIRTADGVIHFMDASSRSGVMKVVLEQGHLSDTIAGLGHATGAIFARPLDPSKRG